jgi:hypothetical protein
MMTVNITVTQTNPLSLTMPHVVTKPVIKPVMQGEFLEEVQLTATIHEFLFKVTKDSHVFWVGVAVPFGTTDFSQIQVSSTRQSSSSGPRRSPRSSTPRKPITTPSPAAGPAACNGTSRFRAASWRPSGVFRC